MNTQDYYNELHDLKRQAYAQLQLSMRTYHYGNVAINNTRLAVIEREIAKVGKMMAVQEEYVPVIPPSLWLDRSSAAGIPLAQFITTLVEQCVQLECYWLFFKDTPKGAEQYLRISKVMTQEASLDDYFEGINRLRTENVAEH